MFGFKKIAGVTVGVGATVVMLASSGCAGGESKFRHGINAAVNGKGSARVSVFDGKDLIFDRDVQLPWSKDFRVGANTRLKADYAGESSKEITCVILEAKTRQRMNIGAGRCNVKMTMAQALTPGQINYRNEDS